MIGMAVPIKILSTRQGGGGGGSNRFGTLWWEGGGLGGPLGPRGGLGQGEGLGGA